MIDVILFRILCAVKFLRTICLIEFFSKIRNTYVSKISMNLCRLNASKDKPKSILIRMKKKMFRIKAKLKESIAKGKK